MYGTSNDDSVWQFESTLLAQTNGFKPHFLCQFNSVKQGQQFANFLFIICSKTRKGKKLNF